MGVGIEWNSNAKGQVRIILHKFIHFIWKQLNIQLWCKTFDHLVQPKIHFRYLEYWSWIVNMLFWQWMWITFNYVTSKQFSLVIECVNICYNLHLFMYSITDDGLTYFFRKWKILLASKVNRQHYTSLETDIICLWKSLFTKV